MALEEALIGAAVGLVVGLVPFVYTVRRDRRDRREREETAISEARERDVAQVEQERQRQTGIGAHYLALLGSAAALLDAFIVDADNADELLASATGAMADIQGFGQGDLLTTFGAPSVVIWTDRACRRLLDEALMLARDARTERRIGNAARATSRAIRALTGTDLDGSARDLMRKVLDDATRRWPEPPSTRFDDPSWDWCVRAVSERTGLPPPTLYSFTFTQPSSKRAQCTHDLMRSATRVLTPPSLHAARRALCRGHSVGAGAVLSRRAALRTHATTRPVRASVRTVVV